MMRDVHGIVVVGLGVDEQTRCTHYASERDVIAIKFRCCDTYYPCYECHLAVTDHPASLWPASDMDEKAVLCGCCGAELTVMQYMNCDNTCPKCGAQFNPGCRLHYHLYFESSPSKG